MEPVTIFLVQFGLSLTVFAAFAAWYAGPWLARLPLATALTILIAPHAFRHIGLSFLVPNLNAQATPEFFAATAGYGDLTSAILALIALAALRIGPRVAIPLIWVFNTVGFADLLNALRQAEAIETFGATWFIPTFIVPLLLVSHVLIFARLLRPSRRANAQPA